MKNHRTLLPSLLLIAAPVVAQGEIGLRANLETETESSETIAVDVPQADDANRVILAKSPAPRAADNTSWRGDLGTPTLSLEIDAPQAPQDPPPKKASVWKGSANLGAYLFDGNTVRRGANLGAKASRRRENDRLTAEFGWDYAESRDTTTTPSSPWKLEQRRVSGGLQQDYFLNKKTYLLATTRATGDTRADLELRFTAGVGIGHQWVESKELSFKTEVGISYVSEDFRSGAPSKDYMAARISYGLEWQMSKNAKLLQDVEALPSLEDSDDITVLKSTRVQVGLTESMFSEFKWELDYDNTPSPGLDRVDHRFFITLGWTF